jgi:predicted nuclease of predicted toxin-antitoxin system
LKVLLDESLPRRLARYLPEHEVITVQTQGWSAAENGALLRAAAQEGFAVFLTADQGIEFQQNLQGLGVGVVIVRARSNRMPHLLPLVPAIASAIAEVRKDAVIRVGA